MIFLLKMDLPQILFSRNYSNGNVFFYFFPDFESKQFQIISNEILYLYLHSIIFTCFKPNQPKIE